MFFQSSRSHWFFGPWNVLGSLWHHLILEPLELLALAYLILGMTTLELPILKSWTLEWESPLVYQEFVLSSLAWNSQTLAILPQTQKGPKHEKNISRVPIDFFFWQFNPKNSYQVLTSKIIIIIPLKKLPK